MQKQKVLTISILISKRPDTVRKCLDSIKPILEELDAELILTDTGCGEEVRGIIEEYDSENNNISMSINPENGLYEAIKFED